MLVSSSPGKQLRSVLNSGLGMTAMVLATAISNRVGGTVTIAILNSATCFRAPGA
jgi:hypothetical protein